MQRILEVLFGLALIGSTTRGADVIDLWPHQAPDDSRQVGAERDFTKPEDRLIAGRRIIKLGNVSQPQIHVYRPTEDKRNGSAVVICPGGGFSILAWDLEGTEVADWLTNKGVTAIVLKYRVPTRSITPNWKAPVQDAQRAIGITRQHANEWNIDPDRIGILGFSAGAVTAARTALETDLTYEPVDDSDRLSLRPNFAILIYLAAMTNDDFSVLRDDITVDSSTPPMFLAHAFDDPVRVENSLLMLAALKRADVPSELHVYDAGGHGYGLRHQDTLPVTTWPVRCEDWLRRNQWLSARNSKAD